jgi:hypothetical protein
MWQDNRQAWELDSAGSYAQRSVVAGETEIATHRDLVERYRESSRSTGEFAIPRLVGAP